MDAEDKNNNVDGRKDAKKQAWAGGATKPVATNVAVHDVVGISMCLRASARATR